MNVTKAKFSLKNHPAKANVTKMQGGYKMTVIGLIPVEWEVQPFGEILSFKNGLNKAKQYFGYGTPIVNYMDVFRNSSIQNIDIEGRVDVSHQELNAYEVRKGDVFFTRTSETVEEIGLSAVIVDDPIKTVFSGFILRGRPKNNSLDNQFKKFCFSSKIIRSQIISKSTYTTRALTNGRVLSDIFLPKPPLKEQKAIAEVLNVINELITSQKELIAKKRDIKLATMQQLLSGNIRLPGFKDEWKRVCLRQIAHIISGGTPSTTKKDYWDGDILWCTPTDITALEGFKYISDTKRKISEAGLKNSSAIITPANSIVMTSRATIGECAINKFPISTNQGFKNFIPYNNLDINFLYYLICTKKQKFISLCTGSTFLEISKAQLLEVEVEIPSKEEQVAIATILSELDSEIDALEEQFNKTKAIKQGMMQELLTGRIRLI